MTQAVFGFLVGVVVGSHLKQELYPEDRKSNEVATERLGAYAKDFGEVSLEAGKLVGLSALYVLGELPLKLFSIGGKLMEGGFEWGVVKPLERTVGFFATGMEVVAHTIAVMMLSFVLFPLVFPLLILAPVFLPLLIPIVIIKAIFREATSSLRF